MCSCHSHSGNFLFFFGFSLQQIRWLGLDRIYRIQTLHIRNRTSTRVEREMHIQYKHIGERTTCTGREGTGQVSKPIDESMIPNTLGYPLPSLICAIFASRLMRFLQKRPLVKLIFFYFEFGEFGFDCAFITICGFDL